MRNSLGRNHHVTHPRVTARGGSGYVMTGWLGCQPPPAKVWWVVGTFGSAPKRSSRHCACVPGLKGFCCFGCCSLGTACLCSVVGPPISPVPPPSPPTAPVGQGHGRADLWWVGPSPPAEANKEWPAPHGGPGVRTAGEDVGEGTGTRFRGADSLTDLGPDVVWRGR